VVRAAAVIIVEGSVALIERRRPTETYYLFPGGGVEDGETETEAVAREVEEELGLIVEVGRLVAEVSYRGRRQRFYLATPTGGAFGTGTGQELQSNDGSFAPVWAPAGSLPDRPVYPRALAELVVESAASGWPEDVAVFEDMGRGGRWLAA
jgi:8-oxo-dGTP pyrophosphatase MutT (NUDIX family)